MSQSKRLEVVKDQPGAYLVPDDQALAAILAGLEAVFKPDQGTGDKSLRSGWRGGRYRSWRFSQRAWARPAVLSRDRP